MNYCTKKIISVQIVHKIVKLVKLRSQHKNTHLFCVFIVYGYFEMPIFGRHTKS